MTVFTCDRCRKDFQRHFHFAQHLARKTPCKMPDHKHDCDVCHKSFGHESSLSRHRKICKGPRVTITDLQEQLQQMQARLDQLGSTSNVTNNIDNSITNIDNSINITLNNYGHESQDHLESLSYSDLKKILKLTPDHSGS